MTLFLYGCKVIYNMNLEKSLFSYKLFELNKTIRKCMIGYEYVRE